MAIYYLTCGLSSLIAYLGSKTISYKKGNKFIVALLSALPMLILSATRYYVGTDYKTYSDIFYSIRAGQEFDDLDIGFVFLCKIVANLGGDYHTLLLITSAIFIFCVFYFIYYDSPYPYVSIYLLFAMQFYFASFNGIRQMCGAAILLFSMKFVEKKRLIPFLICVLIAYTFHNTCLIFIPVYWFDKLKIKPIYIVIISFFVYIFGSNIAILINVFMTNTKYETYALQGGDGNVRLFWTLIQVAIVIFTSFYYKEDYKYNIYFNLQAVTMWLSFMNANVSWIWRIQWTTGLPGIILLPLAISKSKFKGNKVILSIIIMLCFSIYIYISTVNGGKHDVLPYSTFLSIY